MLDTIFSLLCNLSVVMLLCSVVLFVCVFQLPSRSSAVDAYNGCVDSWQQRYRSDLAAVNFTVDWGDAQPAADGAATLDPGTPLFAVEGGGDGLRDEGSDLQAYEPLYYSWTGQVLRPVVPDGVATEFISVTVSAQPALGSAAVASSFNVSVPLIMEHSIPGITSTACDVLQHEAYWIPATRACVYAVKLDTACLRVTLNESWQLFDPGVSKLPSNSSEPLAKAGYGCFYDDEDWTMGRYSPLFDASATPGGQRTRRRLLSLDAANSSTSAPSPASSNWSSPSSSSSSSWPVAEQQLLTVTLLLRHERDPLLYAEELTNNTLWFGLARGSVLLLSVLLLLLAVLAMLGKLGTRFGFWCGLLVLKEWASARRKDWEEGSGGMGRVKDAAQQWKAGVRRVGLGKGRRKGRQLYQTINSQQHSGDDDDDDDDDELALDAALPNDDRKDSERDDDVVLEMKDDYADTDGESQDIARYEIGDLEGADLEDEQRSSDMLSADIPQSVQPAQQRSPARHSPRGAAPDGAHQANVLERKEAG